MESISIKQPSDEKQHQLGAKQVSSISSLTNPTQWLYACVEMPTQSHFLGLEGGQDASLWVNHLTH